MKERHRPRSIPIREDLLYSRPLGRATQAYQSRPTPSAWPCLYARPGFLYGLLGPLAAVLCVLAESPRYVLDMARLGIWRIGAVYARQCRDNRGCFRRRKYDSYAYGWALLKIAGDCNPFPGSDPVTKWKMARKPTETFSAGRWISTPFRCGSRVP